MTKSAATEDQDTVSTQEEETVGTHTTTHGDSLEGADIWGHEDEDDDIIMQAQNYTTRELRQLIRLIDNEIRVMQSDIQLIQFESEHQRRKIRDNQEKIQVNTQPPLLVSTVAEILPPEQQHDDQTMLLDSSDQAEDGTAMAVSANNNRTSAVIKTSTRQTIFLPHPGLVPTNIMRPGDLVGVHKDTYLIVEKLPDEFDQRVKAFEIEDKPTESYSDIAGCDEQIQELVEAVVLPMTHKDMFQAIGIKPPKGVLLYGPPGTGKTLLARACANSTNATFFRLAGPTLVQMYIGDGSRMVRQAFEIAKQKIKNKETQGAILFIDELDAIGTKRYGGDQSGEREVQRTMLELLNQLDGFTQNDDIKVIAATNRPDILDPALLRSGRLDRKIELPMPNENAREKMFHIHSRKMHVHSGAVFGELARSCDGFNGAQIKAVCVEAGMLALRREANAIHHEDFVEAIAIVAAKKKGGLNYFA